MKTLSVQKSHRITRGKADQIKEDITVEVWHLAGNTGWRFRAQICQGRKSIGYKDSFNNKDSLKRMLQEIQTFFGLTQSKFILKGSTFPSSFLQDEILFAEKQKEGEN